MTVTKCQVYWAQVLQENGEGKYTVDLCNLTDEQVAVFEAEDIPVKENLEKKPEQGKYVTCKTNYPPKVMDLHKNKWDPSVKIGNGSVCNVSWSPYPWSYPPKKTKGIAAGLNVVVVVNHVPYIADDEDLFDDADSVVDDGTPFDDPIDDLMDDKVEDLNDVTA